MVNKPEKNILERQGRRGKTGRGAPAKGPRARYPRRPFGWVLALLILLTVMISLNRFARFDKIEYWQFERYLADKHIASANLGSTEITGKFNEAGIAARPKGAPEAYRVNYDPQLVQDILVPLLKESGAEWQFADQQVLIPFLMQWVLPLVIFVGLFYFLFLRNIRNGPGGMLANFGRSRHRVRTKEQTKVTFKDVAGIDEAKEEVDEIIEFLKNPKKFNRLGGRIPRGVLLVGMPGCGKTLLAKAIAGEADVPFFSISGSDFVEMFVGVGASRVRDLFRQAKENSPCIIFLDEVDAIGRKRGPGFVGGGHDEREQTLNAILVEMDGFDTNDQVIVIAATNRGDILDHALTRPGRFDRQVYVPLPDLRGRTEILKVHARKVKMAPDADLERLARVTPMFSGAELAAIINEAAIAATMNNKDSVEMDDLEEARDKVRWGRAKKSRIIDQREKETIAYHEAGHTLVQSLLEHADPLHKVSIIPRGPMGGATFSLPEKDRTIFTRKYCTAMLQICFGGRIAEDIFCDDISSGAQADIQQATEIAKKMVLTWGMSDEVGMVNYSNDAPKDGYIGFGFEREYSEKTAEVIDREIRRLLDDAHKQTRSLIEANKDKLEAIAKALLKYETLDAEEVKMILAGGILEKTTVSDLLAAEHKKGKAGGSSVGNQQSKQSGG
ncbi:MAG: ATP-dependent zinc metalloprotease FtsH [Planctomycetota bacterium]